MGDPHWMRASEWLSGAIRGRDTVGSIGVLGIPLNFSITPGHCDAAPDAIRKILYRLSTYDIENLTDVTSLAIEDFGDVALKNLEVEQAHDEIQKSVTSALTVCDRLVLFGGDNGLTRPALRALSPNLSKVGLITLDAHFDLRARSLGRINGNPISQLLEDGLPGQNIFQLGIHAFANSREYSQVAASAGISVITMSRLHLEGVTNHLKMALSELAKRCEVIYFDLDIDVLDRSYAPACPGARPGGLSPQQIFDAARVAGAHPLVRIMDLVEIDPLTDIGSITSMAAGMAMLSFCSGYAQGRSNV